MSDRIIFIGDVHGCIEELETLWNALEVRPSDRIIQVGDLVNRGPDSHAVIQFCKINKIESILGNHEIRLLSYKRSKDSKILKNYDSSTLNLLTSDDWEYLQSLSHTLYLEEQKIVVVHAGFLPNKNWKKQKPNITSQIQVIDKKGNPQKRTNEPNGTPWATKWEGPPSVIYGHTPRIDIDINKWAIGLDTACVYGHFLTAYILPEMKFVQIPAKKSYAWNKFISPLAQINMAKDNSYSI